MITLLASFLLGQSDLKPVEVKLNFDPAGLDFAGNKARNLMYRPNRANDAGNDEYTIVLGTGPKKTFRLRQVEGTLQADFAQSGSFKDVKVQTIEPREAGAPKSYQATVIFPVSYSENGKVWQSPYGLNFYWTGGRKGLFYYRAGLAKGSVNLNGRNILVEAWEDGSKAIFNERFDTVADPLTANPVSLILQGGRFDARGTFVVDGINYLPKFSPDGRTLTLSPSFKVVSAPARPRAESVKLLANGAKAPDFTVDKFEGGTTKLSEHLGKVVILKFWATWCGPCKASMPHFEEVYNKISSQGVDLLAVCVSDERALFQEWVKANNGTYHFPFSFDPAGTKSEESISRKLYGVTGIPTVYIIDRQGKISASIVGYEGTNDHRVEAALRALDVKL